jgi:hypothetical protein
MMHDASYNYINYDLIFNIFVHSVKESGQSNIPTGILNLPRTYGPYGENAVTSCGRSFTEMRICTESNIALMELYALLLNVKAPSNDVKMCPQAI